METESFRRKYRMLSNFYPCRIEVEGLIFSSVEHAYVASKSDNVEFKKYISSLPAKEAGKAKQLGRKVKLIDNWQKLKVNIMEDLLRKKFSQQKFKKFLVSTKDIKLVEKNYWHDNFWGDCICKKCHFKEGQNMLGKLLMKIREEYIKEDKDGL